MKNKIKTSVYFQLGITLFITACASIAFYFFIFKLPALGDFILKLIRIMMPIILGILFAYLLNPAIKKLENGPVKKFVAKYFKTTKIERKKIIRILSILITYFCVFTIILLIFFFVLPSLLSSLEIMLTSIPEYINNIYSYLKDKISENSDLDKAVVNLNNNIIEYVTKVISPSIDSLMSTFAQGLTSIIKGIYYSIMGIIVSVYLLYDKEQFIKGTQKIMYITLPKKIYENVMTTLTYTDKVFGGFMIAKIIDSGIIGILTFIILSIFKIPYALIISVIVGITNVIPYFGPFIGAIPCATLLFMINPAKAFTFLFLVFLIQQFDGNILGPKLIGNKTGLKSFWVLFSILLFGGLFGFLGMIFGVPLFAVLYAVINNKVNKRLEKITSR